MARLTQIIPHQNFEVIRDRIGEILAEELTAQLALQVAAGAGEVDKNIPEVVWIERITPFDKTELPAVNVSLSNGDYSNKDATQVDGTYVYNIDCYSSAKTKDGSRADNRAALKLQRLLGVCRAILENPAYRTLGYTPPFNCGVSVTSLAIADSDSQDALTTTMGRLRVSVRVPETTELVTPKVMQGYSTSVQLYTTDQGYHYGPQNDPDPLITEGGDTILFENNIDTLTPETEL